MQGEKFKVPANDDDTSIGANLFTAIRNKIALNAAEDFGLPGYNKRTDG